MAVTARLTDQRAEELTILMRRCDHTAVWVATQAVLAAAHAQASDDRPLADYLGRQTNTRPRLIALRGDILDIVDGLAITHTTDTGSQPSRHVIVRAALARLVDTAGGPEAAAEALGGFGANELQGRGVA